MAHNFSLESKSIDNTLLWRTYDEGHKSFNILNHVFLIYPCNNGACPANKY